MDDRVAQDVRHWSWWAGEGAEPETYTVNEPTRDAVIAAAGREFGADSVFTIVEATQDGPFVTDVVDEDIAERVIDAFVDANGHRFGEQGWEGYLDQDALAAELNRAVARFVDARGDDIIVWSFTGQRHREVFGPVVAAEGARNE